MRHSGFYKRYAGFKSRLLSALPWQSPDPEEPLIQDWEVPWESAADLMRFAMREADLSGKPWIATVIRPLHDATLYPVAAGRPYFNLGCYCQVRKPPGRPDYHYTRVIDRKCFDLGGIKMLYSSTFLEEAEFDRLYNGAAYRALKKKYDPEGRFRTLYQKCVLDEASSMKRLTWTPHPGRASGPRRLGDLDEVFVRIANVDRADREPRPGALARAGLDGDARFLQPGDHLVERPVGQEAQVERARRRQARLEPGIEARRVNVELVVAEAQRDPPLPVLFFLHAEHARIEVEAFLEVAGREDDVVDAFYHAA